MRYQNMSTRGRIMDRGGEMRQQVARAGAVAAIVDSLTFGAGGDLNTTEIAAPTVEAIGRLGEKVTKFVAAHPPKAARKAGAEEEVSVIGSGLFEFRARSIWRMQAPPPNERGSDFVVSMRQRKMSENRTNGTLFYTIRFDPQEHSTTFAMATPSTDRTLAASTMSGTDRIVAFLSEHRGQANTGTIAESLDMKPNEVRTYCGRMVGRGLLVKLGGGDTDTAVWGLLAKGVNGSVAPIPRQAAVPPEEQLEPLPW